MSGETHLTEVEAIQYVMAYETKANDDTEAPYKFEPGKILAVSSRREPGLGTVVTIRTAMTTGAGDWEVWREPDSTAEGGSRIYGEW